MNRRQHDSPRDSAPEPRPTHAAASFSDGDTQVEVDPASAASVERKAGTAALQTDPVPADGDDPEATLVITPEMVRKASESVPPATGTTIPPENNQAADVSATIVDGPAETSADATLPDLAQLEPPADDGSRPAAADGQTTPAAPIIAEVSRALNSTLAPARPVEDPAFRGRFRCVDEPVAANGLLVWHAEDRITGQRVILREMDRDADNRSEARLALQQEAAVLAALNHPAVPRITGCGETTRNGFWLVTSAETPAAEPVLGDLITQCHAFPVESHERQAAMTDLLRRLALTAEAVAAVHAAGILHLNLTPETVQTHAAGGITLGGWEHAVSIDSLPAPEEAGNDLTGRSEPHSWTGQPAWTAPEQSRGQAALLSPACDVYTLGSLLYYALTGSPPLDDDVTVRMLAQLRTGAITPPSARNPRLSAGLDAICRRAMSVEASARYASAGELAADLWNWQTGLEATPGASWRERRLARHLTRRLQF